MKLAILLLAVLADEAAAQKPVIILPFAPIVKPLPEPVPVEPASEIDADQWYVIESDTPLIILHSPNGCLSVDYESGPMRTRGRFVDGQGVETRQFNLPHIYFVEATKPGVVELIIIPSGVSSEDEILRQTLTVLGAKPRPPPDDDDVIPDPPGPTVKHVELSIVTDVNYSVDHAIVIGSLTVWKEYVTQGHGWHLYSPRDTSERAKPILEKVGNVPLPALVISDLDTGKFIKTVPLPTTIEGVTALIAEVTGGE